MTDLNFLTGVTYDGVTYPPPPWHLCATTTVAASLIDVAQARAHIPADFEIVELGRGRTLGALGLVQYGPGSIFPYNELVVITGLVRAGNRVGAWISHLWVDSTRSQAGGLELFGLPKQIASFTRTAQGDTVRMDVEAGEGLLLSATTSPRMGWAPPLPGRGSAFGSVRGDRRLLEFRAVARVRPAWARLVIPDQSPFAHLGLAAPRLTVAGRATVAAGTRIQILSAGSLSRLW